MAKRRVTTFALDEVDFNLTECLFMAYAVTRRRFPAGESPTRQPLQPEATGVVMDVTNWINPSAANV